MERLKILKHTISHELPDLGDFDQVSLSDLAQIPREEREFVTQGTVIDNYFYTYWTVLPTGQKVYVEQHLF